MRKFVVASAVFCALGAGLAAAFAATPKTTTGPAMPNCQSLLPLAKVNVLSGDNPKLGKFHDEEDHPAGPSTTTLTTTTTKDPSSPTGHQVGTVTHVHTSVDTTRGTSVCAYYARSYAAELVFEIWVGNGTGDPSVKKENLDNPNAVKPFTDAQSGRFKLYGGTSGCSRLPVPSCTPTPVPGIGDRAIESLGPPNGTDPRPSLTWQKGNVTYQIQGSFDYLFSYPQLETFARCLIGGPCVPGSAAAAAAIPVTSTTTTATPSG